MRRKVNEGVVFQLEDMEAPAMSFLLTSDGRISNTSATLCPLPALHLLVFPFAGCVCGGNRRLYLINKWQRVVFVKEKQKHTHAEDIDSVARNCFPAFPARWKWTDGDFLLSRDET